MDFSLDDKKMLKKTYKVRFAGGAYEITLPRVAVEREARRLGVGEEEVLERLVGVWRFNEFRGLHLLFELKEETESHE